MKIYRIYRKSDGKFWNAYKTLNFSREGHSFTTMKKLQNSFDKLKPKDKEWLNTNCTVVEIEMSMQTCWEWYTTQIKKKYEDNERNN